MEFDTLYPDPEISFSTSMADIPLTIQEMIFGNQIDDNGVLVRTATDLSLIHIYLCDEERLQ